MSQLAIKQPEFDLDRLKTMDTDGLKQELANSLAITARHLLYLAAVWAELESRGVDLAGVRNGLKKYLPFIAAGSLLPEVVIQFAGQITTLNAVRALPVREQKSIVDGEPVLYVVRQGDRYTHRMLPAHALTAQMAQQVFNDGTIRTEAEQIAYLDGRSNPAIAPHKAPRKYGNFRADRERGVILMGRKMLIPADLLKALSELTSDSDEAPGADDPEARTRLKPEELDTLKRRAADGKTTVAKLIRNALRASGAI